ncbi:hypothetical protein J2W55_004760 [Mucilaginibacter pocheonensis]|uniref:Uncharacterized protein n=1 Tax=Mucilaginibacter pocheonensis TaxID=398050 RepID=A0ABU1THK8_9SPHI|nr:hypothetical protein [Mucilaginibacter pocheonensis]
MTFHCNIFVTCSDVKVLSVKLKIKSKTPSNSLFWAIYAPKIIFNEIIVTICKR